MYNYSLAEPPVWTRYDPAGILSKENTIDWVRRFNAGMAKGTQPPRGPQSPPPGPGVRPQPGSEGRSEEGGNHSTEDLPIPEPESLRSQRSLTTKNMREKNHPKILNRIFRKGRAHQREQAQL